MSNLNINIPTTNLVFTQNKDVEDKLKFYKYFIQVHCIMEGIYLPSSELTLLSYYATYGGVTQDIEGLYKRDYKVKRQVMQNTKHKLKSKYGFLVKNESTNSLELPPFLTFNLENGVTFILNFNKVNE